MDVDLESLSEEAWGRWFSRRGARDISLLLYVVWDPVGALGAPEAYDEYDGYAAACLAAIRQDDVDELARVLADIECRTMGFATQAAGLRGTARQLIDGSRASVQRWVASQPE